MEIDFIIELFLNFKSTVASEIPFSATVHRLPIVKFDAGDDSSSDETYHTMKAFICTQVGGYPSDKGRAARFV